MLGYARGQFDPFMDTSGFLFGTTQSHFGDVGGRAKLLVAVPGYGLLWTPYVAATVDRLFDSSTTLNLPNQTSLVGGDILSLQQVAQTFWGAELGLNARASNGITIGMKGFYTASADTNIRGGTAFIKIPFNATPLVPSKY